METRGLKRPGREADHSSPSNVEAENTWSCYVSSRIRLHAMVSIKYRLRLHNVLLSSAQGQLYL